mmetsp:Transcript_122363/g.345879  ORF Transcript_122363/g.345879 Transcript_122363/m.345879 type:complete len:221 (+) Transcript_122363:1329-1991(+)
MYQLMELSSGEFPMITCSPLGLLKAVSNLIHTMKVLGVSTKALPRVMKARSPSNRNAVAAHVGVLGPILSSTFSWKTAKLLMLQSLQCNSARSGSPITGQQELAISLLTSAEDSTFAKTFTCDMSPKKYVCDPAVPRLSLPITHGVNLLTFLLDLNTLLFVAAPFRKYRNVLLGRSLTMAMCSHCPVRMSSSKLTSTSLSFHEIPGLPRLISRLIFCESG